MENQLVTDLTPRKEEDLVDLTAEESNRFFEALEDWSHQLAHYDLTDHGCEHEHPFITNSMP